MTKEELKKEYEEVIPRADPDYLLFVQEIVKQMMNQGPVW